MTLVSKSNMEPRYANKRERRDAVIGDQRYTRLHGTADTMLTLWHVGVSCLVLVVVVCVCPLLASRPVYSVRVLECRDVRGVECRSVGFVLAPT